MKCVGAPDVLSMSSMVLSDWILTSLMYGSMDGAMTMAAPEALSLSAGVSDMLYSLVFGVGVGMK